MTSLTPFDDHAGQPQRLEMCGYRGATDRRNLIADEARVALAVCSQRVENLSTHLVGQHSKRQLFVSLSSHCLLSALPRWSLLRYVDTRQHISSCLRGKECGRRLLTTSVSARR